MLYCKQLIHDLIWDTVIDHLTHDHWVNMADTVQKELNTLEPSVPVDGTKGFIAFSKDGKRLKLKTARFLTRKLNLNSGLLSDAALNTLATRINENLWSDLYDIRLDTGAQITDNYTNSVGGSSCMTGADSCYTRLYEMNPVRYRQLIIQINNDVARAMVIQLDCGDYLLDRIYATSECLRTKMIDYAKQQGWYYRAPDEKQTARPNIYINNDKCRDYNKFVVSNLHWEDGCLPYQDTLVNYEITNNGRLRLFHKCNDNYTSEDEMLFADGFLPSSHPCTICGSNVLDDNLYCIRGEYYCEICYFETFAECYQCGGIILVDDTVLIDGKIYCADCVAERFVVCENCEKHVAVEDAYCIEDTGETICPDCYNHGDYLACNKCGCYYHNDDIDEDGLCNDCKKT